MERWRKLGRDFVADRALRRRAAALGGAAAVALAAGFVLIDAPGAEIALRRVGYYIIAAAFAAFGWALVARYASSWPNLRHWPWRREALPAAALTVLALWLVSVSEPRGFKVVNDEYVLQATALNMHLERDPTVLVRAYNINGVFTPLIGYADKRPLAFQFMLSLMHDLTGFRVGNAFVLNYAFAALNLLLVFTLARRLAGGPIAALTAAVLWAGLPLFVQNANGSGMEVLNLTLLALVMLLAWDYLAEPDEARLNVLVFATLLLAQTRYESALFVPVTALVVLLGWRTAGRVMLPWPVVIAPLLLLPYAWQHEITSANKALWELRPDQDTRFGLLYLSENLRAARDFFFAWENRTIANSWLLSVAGLIGTVAFAAAARRLARQGPLARPASAVAVYGAAVLINLALVMFYYWGRLSDPVAARLALPSLLVGALAVAWLLGQIALPAASRWALAAALIYVAGFMRPQMASRYYTDFNIAVQQLSWEKDFVQQRPAMERLIVSNKTVLPWLMDRQPAINIDQAGARREQLRFHLAAGTFGEILVVQRYVPTNEKGNYVPEPADRVPPDFKLEPLTERRFGVVIDRISRLVAVGEAGPVGQ